MDDRFSRWLLLCLGEMRLGGFEHCKTFYPCYRFLPLGRKCLLTTTTTTTATTTTTTSTTTFTTTPTTITTASATTTTNAATSQQLRSLRDVTRGAVAGATVARRQLGAQGPLPAEARDALGSAPTTTPSTTTPTTTTTAPTTTATTPTTTPSTPLTSSSTTTHKTRIDQFFSKAPVSPPNPRVSPYTTSTTTSTTTSSATTSSTTSTTTSSPAASASIPKPKPPPHVPHTYFRNPFYSLITLNTTSLCNYSQSHESIARRKRIRKTLSRLLQYDFILLQETKLLFHDVTALRNLLHTHNIYYNNNPDNLSDTNCTAGTLIAVKHAILHNYDVTNHAVIPGHCQTLTLNPFKPDWPRITVTNLRLFTGVNKSIVQEQQIKTVKDSLQPTDLRYLAGDLNFTSLPEESTSASPDEPDGWSGLLHEASLTEIKQPDHTFLSASPEHNSHNTSHIDKIFISFPEPEWLLASPKAYVTDKILDDIKEFKSRLPQSSPSATSGISTHLPVVLTFHKHQQTTKRTIYHKNVFEDPDFLTNFKSVCKPPGSSPVTDRANLKAAIIAAYNKTLKTTHAPRRIYQYSICAKALRELDKPNPSYVYIQSMIKHNSFLSHLITWNGKEWASANLRRAINFLLTDGIPDPTSNLPLKAPEQVKPLTPGPSVNSTIETLQRIKLALPSTKKRVSCLRATKDDQPTSNQNELGKIIESHYSKLWGDSHATSERASRIDTYLDDYKCPDDAHALPDLTLDHIKKAILTSGNSAPGPDGLPFIAYRVTIDLSADILYRYAQHIPDSPTDVANFNRSTLLLLPKNDSCLINDTRPLCINNTDNRLITFALVILITPTVDAILDSAQQGFIKGRLMTKHLRDLNKDFYAKWSSDEEYFVLMTDNAKAFDSINHDFIFKVLMAQGFPKWFIDTVRSLLSHVVTNPTLCPTTNIHIRRGVKQGCPLSPILFVLIYDPLIRALKHHSDLTPLAAADDLAVCSISLDSIFNVAMPAIDRFCAASGMGINKDKTQIITSLPFNVPKSFNPVPRVTPVIDFTAPPPPPKTPVATTRKRKRTPHLTQCK